MGNRPWAIGHGPKIHEFFERGVLGTPPPSRRVWKEDFTAEVARVLPNPRQHRSKSAHQTPTSQTRPTDIPRRTFSTSTAFGLPSRIASRLSPVASRQSPARTRRFTPPAAPSTQHPAPRLRHHRSPTWPLRLSPPLHQSPQRRQIPASIPDTLLRPTPPRPAPHRSAPLRPPLPLPSLALPCLPYVHRPTRPDLLIPFLGRCDRHVGGISRSFSF
jgi:hypothetical protein